MLRSRFLWKLYAAAAGLVLGTTLVTGALVHHQMERSFVEGFVSSLRDQTVLVEPYARACLAGDQRPETRAEVARLGREAGVRITLIRPNGEVVADSHEDPARMGNHGSRPEVVAALSGGWGTSQRRSATVDADMLYVARAIRGGEGVAGVVRLALPLADVSARLLRVRATVLWGGAACVLVALPLGIAAARRITAPLAAMTRVAEGLRDGDYTRRVHLSAGRRAARPSDELGVLGEALNRLGEELAQRIAAATRDEAQLRAILSGMVEGVVAVSDDDAILFFNRAAAAMLGLEGESLRGRKLWEVSRSTPLADLLREARRAGRAVGREIALHQEGREIALDARATPFSGGGVSGIVAVLHDVTHLRRLERVRRDFVANVSHELKTPLTSIKGYVETLLSGAVHDDQNNVRFLRKIEAHVGRLTALVQDLLSLARIESQEETLPLAPVRWGPIVEDVIQRHEEAMRRKNISWRLSLAPESPPAMGDPEGMTQIAENLLDNAVKYTPPGGRVDLRVEASGGEVVLTVSDTGPGIPAKDLDRIFERFYRVDQARSRELGGTGLGLAIVKHFAQAMRGGVRVESVEGEGSRFIVSLPAA